MTLRNILPFRLSFVKCRIDLTNIRMIIKNKHVTKDSLRVENLILFSQLIVEESIIILSIMISHHYSYNFNFGIDVP